MPNYPTRSYAYFIVQFTCIVCMCDLAVSPDYTIQDDIGVAACISASTHIMRWQSATHVHVYLHAYPDCTCCKT